MVRICFSFLFFWIVLNLYPNLIPIWNDNGMDPRQFQIFYMSQCSIVIAIYSFHRNSRWNVHLNFELISFFFDKIIPRMVLRKQNQIKFRRCYCYFFDNIDIFCSCIFFRFLFVWLGTFSIILFSLGKRE